LQNFIHKEDTGAPSSFDWRDRRPIAEVLALLQGWDESLVEAIKTFGTCLHWPKTEQDAEERWISAGGKVSAFSR
jgi:hypothetical protein